MLESLTLPGDISLVRTTPAFDADTVPAGLLRGHQVAAGVWGLLCVDDGEVTFVAEATGTTRLLRAGERQVIEPGVVHHVELGPDATFRVEFYR